MPENIPVKIKLALCMFKALNNKTCEEICRLILLLWREFYISISAEFDIKLIKLSIKHKGKKTITKEFEGIKGIKKLLQDLVNENTIRKEDI